VRWSRKNNLYSSAYNLHTLCDCYYKLGDVGSSYRRQSKHVANERHSLLHFINKRNGNIFNQIY